MILGEVPIIVVRPPSSEAKAIGMRKREGLVLLRRASWEAAGIIIASAPMFLMSPEAMPTELVSTSSCDPGRLTH